MSTITTTDGTQIDYKDWGSGQAVVCSHSWPLSADAWEDQMVFLATRGYRCIAHDRRGHGRSSQPWHGNDMDTYADDLATLVAQLDLTNAIHVGHSTGGGEVVRFPQSTLSGFGAGVSPTSRPSTMSGRSRPDCPADLPRGQIRANSQASIAAWEQAKLQYEQAVMTAFHEVSSALTALEKRAQAEAEQARAVTASADAVQIATRRYRGGLASYYEVLEAQQLLFPAETQLAQIRATRLSTSVQLSKVLGGGWTLTDAQWNGPQAQNQEQEGDAMQWRQWFVRRIGVLLGMVVVLAGCTYNAAIQRLSPAEQAEFALYRHVMTAGQVHTYVAQPTAAARTAYLQKLGLVQRFQALDPLDQEAIRSGVPRVGMSADALLFLWEEPYNTAGDARRYAHWYYLGSSFARSSSGYHPWDFGNRVDVYLVGGKVEGWVDVSPGGGIGTGGGSSGN